jgi:hypothetical protein
MRATLKIACTVLFVVAAGMIPAHAACKRFGFTVNDYGKEGPIKDAKALLDKHVANWAAEQGIKDYTIGKKDVSCELFLNFIVFDEHTCTASANVCWGADKGAAQTAEPSESGTPPAPVRKAEAQKDAGHAAKQAAAPAAEAPAAETAGAPAADTASAAAAPAANPVTDVTEKAAAEPAPPPSSEPAQGVSEMKPTPEAPAKAMEPLNATAKPELVETGTIASEPAPAAADQAAAPSPSKPAAQQDAAGATSAAAAAAAAAERAAAAAETAANAAKEAAAAAVAASAASRGVLVPPLDPAPDSKKAARVGTSEAH